MSSNNIYNLPTYTETVDVELSALDGNYSDHTKSTTIPNVTIEGVSPEEFSKDYSDLLPSFEMHNFMFNRTLNEDITPDYQESVTDTVISSSHQIDAISTTDPDLIHSGEFVLNNLHKLQKINLPIEVNITLTKDVPQVGIPFERENPLKQYYPGDMVYGFATFKNKSKVNLPFEMLLVSLECEIGVINPKTRNQCIKKLIAMYDLEASYNHLPVDTYCNTRGRYDPIDNTHVGFKSRVLEPENVVKKFFKFRIPTFLLDDNCDEQFPEHLKIPPSFGLNLTSMKYAASTIHIDPHTGYGRLQTIGSPIQVNDYALPGEFCSYFINVQMIGKRLDAYKQFYTANTTHLYDFIFLKNVEHHFRVGKSPDSNDYRLDYSSTKNQLELMEKTAIETIEVLTEREMLNKIDVTDITQQDEIIFSSSGKSKVATIPPADRFWEKRPLTKSYQTSTIMNFKKDFFSKSSGELTISANMEATATIKSFLPKLMENKATSIFFNEEFMMSSTPVKLELTYKPFDNSSKFPTNFSFTPSMISIGVQSVHNIPFIIDNDYLLEDSDQIKLKFQKFSLYSQKISDMMKANNAGILKTTSDMLKSMAYLRYKEIHIPQIFKSYSIEIEKSKWIFDKNSKTYKTSVTIPLELDIKNILANPKALLPSFQTCKLARLYKIQLNISPKRGKTFKSYFPVTVV